MGLKGMSAGGVIGGVVLLVMLFTVVATAMPLVATAGNLINATTLPFKSFFASNGVIMLAIMGAVLLSIVSYLGFSAGGKR